MAKFYMLTPLLVTQGSSWSCGGGGGGGGGCGGGGGGGGGGGDYVLICWLILVTRIKNISLSFLPVSMILSTIWFIAKCFHNIYFHIPNFYLHWIGYISKLSETWNLLFPIYIRSEWDH